MNTYKLIIIIAISILSLTNSPSFAQGNFTTEWESPVGWRFEVFAKLNVSSNVISLVFADSTNEHSVRIYNGSSHVLEYSWTLPGSFEYLDLSSIFGVQQGYADFYTKQFDVNGDGINEILQSVSFPSYLFNVLNPTNGNSFYSTTNDISRLMDIDADGFVEIIEFTNGGGIKIISTPAQTVSINNENEVISDFDLKQNYPNPFNPNTTIEYSLRKNSDVKVVIFDILGREIKTLVNSKQQAGSHSINLSGNNLSSGTYFFSLIIDGMSETKKMVLIK